MSITHARELQDGKALPRCFALARLSKYAYAITALLITDDATYVTAVIDTGVALPTPGATPAIPRRRG